MEFPKLYKGFLIKRYKRFLADVCLEDNQEIIVAHCPNSGSMLGLINHNSIVYVSKNTNPNNKLDYKLELIQSPQGALVCINTGITNKLVLEALHNSAIKELDMYQDIQMEKTFNKSRFDFYLSNQTQQCFMEIKSVSLLRQDNLAEFPDAITQRGNKHLEDLQLVSKCNMKAINLYIIQRNDAKKFSIAKDIDINYYNNFIKAKELNVEFLCYDCEITTQAIKINNKIEIIY
jgi:sugar fermentation stimulation protein A